MMRSAPSTEAKTVGISTSAISRRDTFQLRKLNLRTGAVRVFSDDPVGCIRRYILSRTVINPAWAFLTSRQHCQMSWDNALRRQRPTFEHNTGSCRKALQESTSIDHLFDLKCNFVRFAGTQVGTNPPPPQHLR